MPVKTERPITEVMRDIVRDIQDIIRSETKLGQIELRQEAVKAARAGAMLGAGALLASYALGFLLLAAVFALTLALPAWLAALIVCAGTTVMALVCLWFGRARWQLVHPAPTRTIETVKENVEWIRQQSK